MQPEGYESSRSGDLERGNDDVEGVRPADDPRYLEDPRYVEASRQADERYWNDPRGDAGCDPAPALERRADSSIEDAFDFGGARRAAASRSAERAGGRRRDLTRSRHDVDAAVDREASQRRAEALRDQRELPGYRVEDYLGEAQDPWETRPGHLSPVVEFTDVVDEEEVWGPRPKLLAAENGGRRTVVITGHAADGYPVLRTAGRDGLPAYARHGFSADRTAMWAVLLCVIVLLVAITSH